LEVLDFGFDYLFVQQTANRFSASSLHGSCRPVSFFVGRPQPIFVIINPRLLEAINHESRLPLLQNASQVHPAQVVAGCADGCVKLFDMRIRGS
jgi:hypothetical protein